MPRPKNSFFPNGVDVILYGRALPARCSGFPRAHGTGFASPTGTHTSETRILTPKFFIDDGTATSLYELLEPRTLVGREAGCDLVLADPRVSRRHLELLRDEENRVWARDLGASNTTLLNGRPLEEKTLLEEGDVLELGGHRLHFGRVRKAAQPIPSSSSYATRPRPRPSGHLGLAPLACLVVLVGSLLYLVLPDLETATPQRPPEKKGAALADEAHTTEAPETVLRPEEIASLQKRARRLKKARLAIRKACLQGDFEAAAGVIADFEDKVGSRSLSLRNTLESAVAKERERLTTALALRQGRMRPDELSQWWASRMERHPETLFPGAKMEWQAALSTLPEPATRGIAQTTAPAEDSTAEPPASPPDTASGKTVSQQTSDAPIAAPDPFKIQGAAENLLFQRRFGDAARAFGEAARAAAAQGLGPELVSSLERRQRDAQRREDALMAILNAARETPQAFKGIPVLPNRKADVSGVDDRQLVFRTPGEPLTLPIRRLNSEALIVMAERVRGREASDLSVAWLLLEAGRDTAAHRLMHQVASQQGAATEATIASLLADHLRLDAIPSAIVWYEGRYITDRDRARIALADQVKKLLPRIQDPDSQVRAKAYGELRALGSAAAFAFHQAILRRKGELLKHLKATKSFRKLDAVAQLHAELEDARQAALELIFDKEKYPYPYRDRGPEILSLYQETQTEIDRRVARIRSIWNSSLRAAPSEELEKDLALIREIDTLLADMNLDPGQPVPAFLEHLPTEQPVTVRTFARSSDERTRIDESALWMRENAEKPTVATAAEKTQVRITNEYRVMMGRHAVRIHDTLVRCARMHSTDMSKGGWFSHFNPNDPKKRTPRDRAKLVGYEGIGISENIARNPGGPAAAHQGWIHSSGHHRNILSKSWRLLGVGNAGSNWTQNFSIREVKPEEKGADPEGDTGDGTPENGGDPDG